MKFASLVDVSRESFDSILPGEWLKVSLQGCDTVYPNCMHVDFYIHKTSANHIIYSHCN